MRRDVITAAPIGLRVNQKRVAEAIGVSQGSARQVTDEADAIQSLAATSSAVAHKVEATKSGQIQ
jgi:hypothetical protein